MKYNMSVWERLAGGRKCDSCGRRYFNLNSHKKAHDPHFQAIMRKR